MKRRGRDEPLEDNVQSRILDWMLDGETCMASRNIVTTYRSGYAQAPGTVPIDVWELGCCILMLEQVPEARAGLEILAESSERWRALTESWDKLEASLRDEFSPTLNGISRNGAGAIRTKTLLREILAH